MAETDDVQRTALMRPLPGKTNPPPAQTATVRHKGSRAFLKLQWTRHCIAYSACRAGQAMLGRGEFILQLRASDC